MTKKVGLYIGAFDPFHEGHYEVCQKSIDYVDSLIVQPHIDRPWTKFSYENRIALIAQQTHDLNNLVVRREKRNVYDLRTDGKFRYQLIKWVEEEFGKEIWMVMGSDKLENPMYRDPNSELFRYPHIIFVRNNRLETKYLSSFKSLIILEGTKNISGSEITKKN